MKKEFMNNLIPVFFLAQLLLVACSVQDNSIERNKIALNVSQQPSSDDKSNESSNQLGRHIVDIFEDSQGILWFGTGYNGVASYDGKDLNYITSEDGLCGMTVANIIEDKDGVLWFGTYSDMCRYDLKGSKDSRSGSFAGFEKDAAGVPYLGYGWKRVQTDTDGNLWVNTHQGIFQYTNSEFIEFVVPGVDNTKISFCNTPGVVSMDFVDSKGNLWFGTDDDGVYMYDGNTFSHFTKKDGLTSNSITSIEEDRNGNIWFGCSKLMDSTNEREAGVCSYNGTAFTEYLDVDGLHHNTIHTLYSDRNNDLWIGANGTGVYKFDGESFKLYKEPKGVDYTDPFQIGGLQSVLEDSKGRHWFGFSGGLFRLEGESLVNVQKNGPWE